MQHARRGLHVGGNEALALVVLLQFAETLQFNVKAAIKDDADFLQRFMPLSEKVVYEDLWFENMCLDCHIDWHFFSFANMFADIRYVYKWILDKVHSAAYRWRWCSKRFFCKTNTTSWRHLAFVCIYIHVSCLDESVFLLYASHIVLISSKTDFPRCDFSFTSIKQQIIGAVSLICTSCLYISPHYWEDGLFNVFINNIVSFCIIDFLWALHRVRPWSALVNKCGRLKER